MPATPVTVEQPEELIELIGTTELTADRIREALVLHLLWAAAVSQGQALRLLGIGRWDLLTLWRATASLPAPSRPTRFGAKSSRCN